MTARDLPTTLRWTGGETFNSDEADYVCEGFPRCWSRTKSNKSPPGTGAEDAAEGDAWAFVRADNARTGVFSSRRVEGPALRLGARRGVTFVMLT